jgi:hypothetical protein
MKPPLGLPYLSFVVLVGTCNALAMAVRNQDPSQRQTNLKEFLQLNIGKTNTQYNQTIVWI